MWIKGGAGRAAVLGALFLVAPPAVLRVAARGGALLGSCVCPRTPLPNRGPQRVPALILKAIKRTLAP